MKNSNHYPLINAASPTQPGPVGYSMNKSEKLMTCKISVKKGSCIPQPSKTCCKWTQKQM